MTKEEKAEDYDRLQYEFTQISQDLKSEKRKNKAQAEQLILFSVVVQREQLVKFLKEVPFSELEKSNFLPYIDKIVDDYLTN
jgi:hypothetical protein